MKNIINKILDNYFSEKLANAIKERIEMQYALDIKIKKLDDYMFVEARPFKYKNYTPIHTWQVKNVLIQFFNFDNIIKPIKGHITHLDKENRWD